MTEGFLKLVLYVAFVVGVVIGTLIQLCRQK